jgi:hypothetical protein
MLGVSMDKILIVTDRSEPNYDLLTLLSKVFPDCEIEIVIPEAKKDVEYWASQHMWSTITKKMGRA